MQLFPMHRCLRSFFQTRFPMRRYCHGSSRRARKIPLDSLLAERMASVACQALRTVLAEYRRCTSEGSRRAPSRFEGATDAPRFDAYRAMLRHVSGQCIVRQVIGQVVIGPSGHFRSEYSLDTLPGWVRRARPGKLPGMWPVSCFYPATRSAELPRRASRARRQASRRHLV